MIMALKNENCNLKTTIKTLTREIERMDWLLHEPPQNGTDESEVDEVALSDQYLYDFASKKILTNQIYISSDCYDKITYINQRDIFIDENESIKFIWGGNIEYLLERYRIIYNFFIII
jgi:hypothetical protein